MMNKYIVMVVVALATIGEPLADAQLSIGVGLPLSLEELTAIVLSKCSNYNSAVVNDSMLDGTWRLVETTTNYTCTTLTVSPVITLPNNTIITSPNYAVLAYNESGVYRLKNFTAVNIKPGHYILKQIPTDDVANQTLATFYIVYLNVTSDTLMTTMCPLLGTSTYQAFQIYTIDGRLNPTVKVFEAAARQNGIPMDGVHTVKNSGCPYYQDDD